MQLPVMLKNREGTDVFLSDDVRYTLSTLTVNVLQGCENVPNIEHIWYSKQRVVKKLYDLVKDDINLKELHVFGSSTQERCTVNSDLDIAYKYNGDAAVFFEQGLFSRS